MLACGERHFLLHIVKFVPACSRDFEFANRLAVDRERECTRTFCSNRCDCGVITSFGNVDGVFEPVASIVIAQDNASRLLVEVGACILAVVGIAVIFEIVTIGFIACSVVILALARLIEIFNFDLARNSNRRALERFLRNRFHRSDNASVEAGRIDALVLGEVILEPSHCRTILTILDDTGVTVVNPGCAIDVSPKGDTGNVLIFHEVGNLFLIALFLDVVVISTDIVFRNEHRSLGLVPNFANDTLESIDVQAAAATASTTSATALSHHVMSLQTISVNRSTIPLDGVDKVDTFVLLPLNGIVVVINQDCLRPTFTSHLESGRHELVVTAVIATESANNVVAITISRVILVVASTDSFVHHVDHFNLWVMLLDGIEPSGNSLLGFVNAKAIQPVRILGAPHQCVELEVTAIVLSPVIAGIAPRPVITSAGAFNGSPLTFVFRGNLVPVLAEVALDLTASCYVTDKLSCTISQARTGNSTNCTAQKRCRYNTFYEI